MVTYGMSTSSAAMSQQTNRIESNLQPARVLIADDHTLFRRLLMEVVASRADVEFVEEACNGLEAVEKAKRMKPNVILMDISMPRLDGIEATKQILEELPDAAVVILTVSEDASDLMEAAKAGARGYLLKNVEPGELIRAICMIRKGEGVISPIMTSKLLQDLRLSPGNFKSKPTSEAACLTERESEILKRLAQGASNREIAEDLSIAEATVRTHVHRILAKLGLHNRTQAAAYVLQSNQAEGQRYLA